MMTTILRRFNSSCIRRVNGKPMKDIHNPGVFIENDFIDKDTEQSLLKETLLLSKTFSFEACESLHLVSNDNNTNIKRIVKAHRVTGRPEHHDQIKAPWSYGDNFKIGALEKYPEILKIATKIIKIMKKETDSPELRDITINYRKNSMFMLDPHIDPADDGGHVFILGLQSPTVLTLIPDLDLLARQPNIFKNHIEPPIKVRNQMDAISALSWTDIDLDILLYRRSLVHIKDDARNSFKHAIRAGVVVDSSSLPDNKDEERKTIICDWFGNINNLIPRELDRTSIIFAFK